MSLGYLKPVAANPKSDFHQYLMKDFDLAQFKAWIYLKISNLEYSDWKSCLDQRGYVKHSSTSDYCLEERRITQDQKSLANVFNSVISKLIWTINISFVYHKSLPEQNSQNSQFQPSGVWVFFNLCLNYSFVAFCFVCMLSLFFSLIMLEAETPSDILSIGLHSWQYSFINHLLV